MGDVVRSGETIQELLKDDAGSIEGDELLCAAVYYHLIIMGEAINRIAKSEPIVLEGLPHWRDIVGMRNVLTHAYDQVDIQRVVQTIRNDIPNLVVSATSLLGE